MKVKVSASILSADFSKLGEEVQQLEAAGADYIHIDVMDGHFVPNITIGPCVIKAIRPLTNLPFDVHLMISPAFNYIHDFASAGSDIITIHAEGELHLEKTINEIKSLGKKVGISILPSTNPNVLEYLLNDIDLILVMSVNPGFGGQKLLQSQLRKISDIRSIIDRSGKDIILEVDGGINQENTSLVIGAGADVLVSGSAIFKSSDYYKNITDLKR